MGATHALKISDGSPAGEPGESGKCEGAGEYTGGKAPGPGGGTHLSHEARGRSDLRRGLTDRSRDGKAKWTYTFHPEKGRFNPGMSNGGEAVSIDPVVLYPDRQDMGLIALDRRTGKLRSRFPPDLSARPYWRDGQR
ncbi:hypothetical protein ACFWIY_31875 [Streptomyces sioyaensis]|uniref:hypothetical protein n=1 Tax=Streptomyces sioyaensis TaxID=67364 RepID=UPI00365716D6